MMRLAKISSIGAPKKIIRSLSRREVMSYARSPRFVCSITIGTVTCNVILWLWCSSNSYINID